MEYYMISDSYIALMSRFTTCGSWEGHYILDFLKALSNEGEVRLEFKDAQSAGQMRPEDPDAEYRSRYVLMPMRI